MCYMMNYSGCEVPRMENHTKVYTINMPFTQYYSFMFLDVPDSSEWEHVRMLVEYVVILGCSVQKNLLKEKNLLSVMI